MPELGDVAIYTYRYKNKTYTEFVMYRHDWRDLTILGWFNGQGEKVADGPAVQMLPSAAHLHARLDLPDPLAYRPKLGDVGTYTTPSGTLVTVTYRRNDKSCFSDPEWYQANGVLGRDAHTAESFKLLIRDGEIVD